MVLNSAADGGILNRGILRDFLVVSSRPCGTFRLSNLYPGLRPGLSSAVPSGLILRSMVLTQTLKPVPTSRQAPGCALGSEGSSSRKYRRLRTSGGDQRPEERGGGKRFRTD